MSSSKPSKMASTDPEYYKKTRADKFNLNSDLEDIYKSYDGIVNEQDWPVLRRFIHELIKDKVSTARGLQSACIRLRRQVKQIHKKSVILHVLRTMQASGEVPEDLPLNRLLITKAGKSTSGVLVITVLTSPYPSHGGKTQKFSCEWNCYYCPNEPDQPRSYLHDEPSVLRANRNRFDPVLQFNDRALALAMNGHPVDKIEMLILGGTWASYPEEYQEGFIRDLFYAANTFLIREDRRERLSLDEEKKMNETATCKIIGITLETRPDCITPDEIRRFRRYGCTRVQIGVQHTNDAILKKINRGCTNADTKRALRLLKDSCYKIDIHLMPNLPGSNPEIDKAMFDEVLEDEDLQADQWKIYPCEVVPWTVIEKWHRTGKYVPYDEDELSDVLIDVKRRVHPWIRLNRVVRDIPSQYIVGGVDRPSMRQDVLKEMQQMGLQCNCIRCREIKGKDKSNQAVLKVRKYHASGGTEYFISFETPNERWIFGFARLRIVHLAQKQVQPQRSREVDKKRPTGSSRRKRVRSKSPAARLQKSGALEVPFPELRNAALVRELHVYGKLKPTEGKGKSNSQHFGFGTKLMRKCEEIAREHEGVTKVAVISGVGVRNFYRKLGYELHGEGEMMIKSVLDSTYLNFAKLSLVIMVAVSIGLQLLLVANSP